MNKRYPQEDTKPWYKQFWPWFVFSLPAIAVIAGIATVIIAERHKPVLISRDDPFSTPVKTAPAEDKPPPS